MTAEQTTETASANFYYATAENRTQKNWTDFFNFAPEKESK